MTKPKRRIRVDLPGTLGFVMISSVTGSVYWRERRIGRVYKGTRTYSPPLYKGSRVAKFHKQVPCWWAETMITYHRRDHRTRKEAIIWLIEWAQKEAQDE